MTNSVEYESVTIPNVLRSLDDKNILLILCISSASNDLKSNIEALKRFSKEETRYFSYNSISIVREIAKLIEQFSNSGLESYYSAETTKSFCELYKVLFPFTKGSFSSSVLKPIRDVNFHYDYSKFSNCEDLKKLLES